MLFDYQSPAGPQPKGEQFDPLPTLTSNANSGMSLYPSAKPYDSPTGSIGLGPVELGAAQRQRLNRQYDGLQSQVGQRAVNSGLYNTTVPMSEQQAVERGRGQAMTSLDGQLMDEEMSAYRGMTGDALIAEVQNRLSTTSEIDSATADGIVSNISNVLDQIAFLEAKEEKGPNLDKLREIVSLLGQSLAESNGVPSVVLSGLGSTGSTGADDTFGNAGFQPQVNGTLGMLSPSMESQLQDYENSIIPLNNIPGRSVVGSSGSSSGGSSGSSSGGSSGSGGGMGGGGIGSGVTGSVGSVGSSGSSPSGSNSSAPTPNGSSYVSVSSSTLSDPAAQQAATASGLKVGATNAGAATVLPPNSADYDSIDRYEKDLGLYQRFSAEYPEFVERPFNYEDLLDGSNLDADLNPVSTPDRELRSDLPLSLGENSKWLPEESEWDLEGYGPTMRKKKLKEWKKQYPGIPYGMNPEYWRAFLQDDFDSD